MTYRYIINNPYIVGNPIKSERMFFGREEDFKIISERLQRELKGVIITLVGEQRSGKTSILFQILNGRLGQAFMPFFIDMQTMVDVTNNKEFLQKLDDIVRKALYLPPREVDFSGEGFSDFEKSIVNIQKVFFGKKLVLMFDEYELLENKFERGQVNQEMVVFFANLMENRNVFFIFTGSYKLKDRNPKYWKSLLSKSLYRNISFLNYKDCISLITKPLEGYANYTDAQTSDIYRLTAGQPLYTQFFCQSIVDKLISEKRNNVTPDDITQVVADFVNHPMPQMVYFWTELTRNQKITLSILAEIIQTKEQFVDSQNMRSYLKKNKLNYLIETLEIKSTLEGLVSHDILTKKDNKYMFLIDLFRYWIKQDQNIWKVLHDYGLDHDPDTMKWTKVMRISVISVVVIAALSVALYFGARQWTRSAPPPMAVHTIQPGQPVVNPEIRESRTAISKLELPDNPDGKNTSGGNSKRVQMPSSVSADIPKFSTVYQYACSSHPASDHPGAVCAILSQINSSTSGQNINAFSGYSPIGFIVSILSKTYQMDEPDSTFKSPGKWTTSNLYRWLEKKGFQPRKIYKYQELNTGDLVHCSGDKGSSVFFFLKYAGRPYVYGIHLVGLQISAFDSTRFIDGYYIFKPS